MSVDENIAIRLLHWYDAHRRTLPWRAEPGERADPYRVWLSEIMLQQTTVAAVKPYFAKFTQAWPDVGALAAADESDLMTAWAGLGYYARARNLVACARHVAGALGGVFPDSEDGLRALPGVGAYTAAAVAAIAFDRPATVVDANVERVVARLFAIDTPLPAARPEIRMRAGEITPQRQPGDFAQAMMDLGSGICTPRNPACAICPLLEGCAARMSGDPAAYPVKAAKKARPVRHGHIWWMEADGDVRLVRRPGRGLLGGMRALPTSDWGEAPDSMPPVAGEWTVLNESVDHVFTHFALELTVHMTRVKKRCISEPDGEWWPIAEIGAAGLPTVFAKAATAAVKARGTIWGETA